MDLMGKTVQLPYGGSSANVTRNSFASGRPRHSVGPGLKKLPSSGGHGRFSVSGRSVQSIAGIRSENNYIESYGFQLPVLVNEALTFNEHNQYVSVNCAQNGWAWIVNGRRLLVWQYKDIRSGNSPPRSAKESLQRVAAQRRGGGMAQCRELTLPHCDIGQKASLVNVFQTDGQQMASCLAVSPTGDVRYWPSIAHDGSSVDVTVVLDGQEFDRLLEVPKQNGYLVVTTTCFLVFLQLQFVNGRHVLHHKTIRQQSGFLGGIGKKFASIIIGMNSGPDKENKFVSITAEANNENDGIITVLADRWLQRWRLSNNGNHDQLLYEDSDIIRRVRDEFHQKFWNVRSPTAANSVDIQLHLLDMQVSEGKMYILAGAVNTVHMPQMYYGIVTVVPENDAFNFVSFMPIKLVQFFNSNTEKECLSLRFIISRSHFYVYSEKLIYPLNLHNPSQTEMEIEKIEFQLQDDRILNAAICSNIPLFFSRSHGLICVTPGDFDSSDGIANMTDTFAASPFADFTQADETSAMATSTIISDTNLYMFELDPDTIYQEFKDDVSQMKAAFVYFLKHNSKMCTTILNDLLRNTVDTQATSINANDRALDKIVVTIAEDLAEDIPAADPRWEQVWGEQNVNRHALGSSSSLQILTQLKEKNLALKHFIEFLHSTSIWEKLTALQSGGGGNLLKPTSNILADINEKIIAAITLRSLQSKHNKIIDEAINRVITQWKETAHGPLTAQDIFYVRVCKFQDIFQVFTDLADSRIEMQHQTSTVASFLADINTIALEIVSKVQTFRDKNASTFSLPTERTDAYEYLPWTAMSGNIGLRDSLTHLVDISVRYGARCTSDAELKQRLYQQILELIDFILDGRKNYLESVHDTEKYNVLLQQFESQRRDFISILIQDGQYEFAAKLAEKYLDFHSLVVICDETNNQERLDMYIKKYEEYDFSQIAINWHLRQNRQGEVFERFKGNQAALSQFMRDHPTLGWIQLVFNGDFERASKILFQLAMNEKEFVQRKKSMLSLAKLAAFSAPDSDHSTQVENINVELTVIDYQEQLNANLLQAYGYDVENQKVLKVDEIINLYIAEENEGANEFEFRKALELLNYLEDSYEMRMKIWCAAILRDNWTDYDVNSAVDYLQDLLFFKLVEVCHLMDGDLETFLPQVEEFLICSDLENLFKNKSFEYLFKLMYEHIGDAFKPPNDDVEMAI